MNSFKIKVINNAFMLFTCSLFLGFTLMFMRVYEAYYLDSNLYYQFNAYGLLTKSIFIDFKSSIVFSSLLIPFVFFSRNFSKYVLIFFLSIIILSSFLQHYFLTNFELLGNNTFTFTLEEILFILKIELFNLDIGDLFVLLFFPFSFVLSFLLLLDKINFLVTSKIKKICIAIYVLFLLITSIEYNYYLPRVSKFVTYHQYEIGNNKLTYFIADYISSKLDDKTTNKSKIINENISDLIRNYRSKNSGFEYLNNGYPLMHTTPYNNALGPFFKKDSTIKPNVVILMIESLSRSFSGPNPHLGSFTPFLDSLKNESLYWENFLSNVERTYGVLPNSLSSAPFFLSQNRTNPYVHHTSLIKELNQEKYTSSFSCGVWTNFNSMSNYLNENKIHFIFGENDFDENLFIKYESSLKDFHWGFDDGALLQQHMLRKEVFKEPYLSVLLTISMHPPYDVAHDYTLEKALKHLGETTEFQKKLIKKHPEKIKSIIYVDEQLELFFENYKKRPEYENTIFLIYGDHNIHSLPEKNRLDGFHVPLIIHSDLINRKTTFKGLSTHRDITPSILGLLEGNYNMKFSKEKHWLNRGFDTSINFNANFLSPMVLHSNLLINYIYEDHVVVGNKDVFVMDSLLNLKPQTDQKKANEMLNHYNDYILLEQYMKQENKLYK